MSAYDPHKSKMGFHPRSTASEVEARKREAVLRLAERHFTAAELSALLADMANGDVDVRIYDDGIVLMRKF
jgi:hypothetical protein